MNTTENLILFLIPNYIWQLKKLEIPYLKSNLEHLNAYFHLNILLIKVSIRCQETGKSASERYSGSC